MAASWCQFVVHYIWLHMRVIFIVCVTVIMHTYLLQNNSKIIQYNFYAATYFVWTCTYIATWSMHCDWCLLPWTAPVGTFESQNLIHMQRGNLGIFHFCIRLQVFVYIMAKKQQTHHKEDSEVENRHNYSSIVLLLTTWRSARAFLQPAFSFCTCLDLVSDSYH